MNRQIKTIFKQLFKIFLKASKDALTITHGNNQKKKKRNMYCVCGKYKFSIDVT